MAPSLLLMFVPAAPALAAIAIGVRAVRGDAPVARLAAGSAAAALLLALAACAVDRLAGFVSVAVAAIALIVMGYAARAMQGGSIAYGRFFALLAAATAGSLAIAVATDLRVLAAAWILTGIATSALLGVARHRPAARRWARRHALLERAGDLAWLAILLLAWRSYGTFDLAAIARAAPHGPQPLAIAFALVVAGAIRSALVPVHGWLPNSMEAPTPVSAFMHAGIVNGAGVLFAKTAFVLASAPAALIAAAVLGAATAAAGATVALVRPESKRRLGWSTVAQMGFMVLQCGSGAFAAAIVHLAAHGGYKSAAFLGVAGSIDAHERARRIAARPAPARPWLQAAASFAPPTLGVAAVWLPLHDRIAQLPAAAFVLALVWAAGVCAARGIAEQALPQTTRLRALLAVAAAVAAYLAAVVLLEAWLGDALPRITIAPVAVAAALAALAAGALEGAGVRPRGGDRLYAVALTEGQPVAGVPA